MITLRRFRTLEHDLVVLGHGPTILWSESIAPPEDANDFAARTIYVICNSGMKATVAGPIYVRCMAAVTAGVSATIVFGHLGKSRAIDDIWLSRERYFSDYLAAIGKVDGLELLPWIGPVTKHHLAKNLGVDTAKPDVHLERLARGEGTTTQTLCRRMSRASGYRVATVDTILWRACADGILNSRIYESDGWLAAYRGQAQTKSEPVIT